MNGHIRHRLRQPWALPLVCIAGLGLAGCGDSPDRQAGGGSTTADKAVDACELVTSAEAAEALGVPAVEQERPSSSNVAMRLASCLYSAELGPRLVVLHVMARPGYSASEATDGFSAMKEVYGETEIADVPELGDQAFWIEELRQLWLLEGTLQVGISGDISFDQAKALAAGALGRID